MSVAYDLKRAGWCIWRDAGVTADLVAGPFATEAEARERLPA